MNFYYKLNRKLNEAFGEGAFTDLLHLLQNSDRVHFSEKPITQLEYPPTKNFYEKANEVTNKPIGLWYSFGASWLDFDYGAQKALSKYNYVYEVVPGNDMEILTVNSSNVEEITEKYGLTDDQYKYWSYPVEFGGLGAIPMTEKIFEMLKKGNSTGPVRHLWWLPIYAKYEGIEVPRVSTLDVADWLYGWDAASGCIWATSGVQLNLIFGPEDLKHKHEHDYSEEDDEALFKKLYGDVE